jgi:hypothetical protein
VTRPTPLLDFFKRREVARDVRLLAAEGALAPTAHEQLSILIVLLEDADAEIAGTAERTIGGIPLPALTAYLARSDVPPATREFFAARGVMPGETPSPESDDPLIDTSAADAADAAQDGAPPDGEAARESLTQQILKMGFSDRLKAAVKGSREMRAILIRDPNKMISASVLSSPKITDNEVESYSRMANVSEDVLRIIGSNRSWMKNYGIVVGLTRNPKTPLGMSLNLMNRLNDRDLQLVSIDRNVPEPLRIAARKKIVGAATKR